MFADCERIDILDNHQVRGDLFELVGAAELYILNNTRRAFIIDDSSLHRDERPEIPKRAIREGQGKRTRYALSEEIADK